MCRATIFCAAAIGAILAVGPVSTFAASGEPGLGPAQQCQGQALPRQRAEACAAILALNPSPKEAALAHHFRALAEIDLGQRDLAVTDLNEAVANDPGLVVARWLRAELLDGGRQYDLMVADLSEVIRHYPTVASVYHLRGVALDNRGDSTGALADIDRAIALAGPKGLEPGIYVDRAEAHGNNGELDKAIADFGEAIQRNDHSPDYYVGRARIAYAKGDAAGALADLEKADQLHPSDNYYILWIYLTNLRLGRDADADLRRRAAGIKLSEWPGPIIRLLLGDVTRDQIATPTIPQLWSESDRKAGADCEIGYYLGEQSRLKGDHAKAIELFQRAIASNIKEYVEFRAAKIQLEQMKQ
jgi:lipoprotein NlpI